MTTSAMDYDKQIAVPDEPIETQTEPGLQDSGAPITLAPLRDTGIGLQDEVRARGVDALSQLLIDLVALDGLMGSADDAPGRALRALADRLDERIRILGGLPVRDSDAVADMTLLPDAKNRPETDMDILCDSHRIVLSAARDAADTATRDGDWGSAFLLGGDLIPALDARLWRLSGAA